MVTECSMGKFFRPWDQEERDAPAVTQDLPNGASNQSPEAGQQQTAQVHTSHQEECFAARTIQAHSFDPRILYQHNMLQLPEAHPSIGGELGGGSRPARKPRPKKYVCDTCGCSFSNNGQLKGHKRSHTGERPFKCVAEGCEKAFARNEELTRHKLIHSGEKPYNCIVCGRRFGRKDHLKKHRRTHEAQHSPASFTSPFQLHEFIATSPSPPLLAPNINLFSFLQQRLPYPTFPFGTPAASLQNPLLYRYGVSATL